MDDYNQIQPQESNSNDRVTPKILLSLIFLLPFFLVPSSLIGVPFSKSILLFIGVTLALISWGINALKSAEIRLPHAWATILLLLLPVVYFASAIVGPSTRTSLMGHNLSIDSAMGVLMLTLLAFLVASTTRTQKTLVQYYLAFFLSLVVVALLQVARLMFGADALSFGVLGSAASSFIGKWNDMSVFFGLGVVTSLVALSTLPRTGKILRVLSYIVLVVSLVFLTIVNFTLSWYVVGIVSLLILVYGLSSRRRVKRDEHEDTERGGTNPSAIVASVIVLALSVLFVFSGSTLGGSISDSLGTSQAEVRPSWDATVFVVDETLKDSPALGAGPNRFAPMWLLHKPDGINSTAFWRVEFNSGFGTIPSSPVTVGIVGLAAWLLLFGLILLLAVKSIFLKKPLGVEQFLVIVSSISSLYLMVFMFLYTPGVVVKSLTFLMFGLLLSSLYTAGQKREVSIQLPERPLANFIFTLLLIIIVVFGVLGVYSSSERIFGEVLFQKGLSSIGEGDFDAGQRSILRATQFYPSDVYHRALSASYVVDLSRIVRDQETPDNLLVSRFQETLGNAISSARRAIEIDGANYANHVSLADVYASVAPLGIDGALENAVSSYKKAIELNPGADLYLALARLEASSGSIEGARLNIGKALESKGNYIDAVFLLAQIQVAEGNIAEAIRSVEVAASVSPSDPVIFFQLGLLRYSNQDYSAAVSALESAVALSPVYANAQYFLGLAYEQVGRVDDAIKQFEAIQETNPDNTEVTFILQNLRAGRSPFVDATPPIDEEPENREDLPIEE